MDLYALQYGYLVDDNSADADVTHVDTDIKFKKLAQNGVGAIGEDGRAYAYVCQQTVCQIQRIKGIDVKVTELVQVPGGDDVESAESSHWHYLDEHGHIDGQGATAFKTILPSAPLVDVGGFDSRSWSCRHRQGWDHMGECV